MHNIEMKEQLLHQTVNSCVYLKVFAYIYIKMYVCMMGCNVQKGALVLSLHINQIELILLLLKLHCSAAIVLFIGSQIRKITCIYSASIIHIALHAL